MGIKKLVIVTSTGKLPIFGGIVGPITTPTMMDSNNIIILLNHGKTVYEVCQWDYTKKVLLNSLNVISNNFNKNNPKSITKPKELPEVKVIKEPEIKPVEAEVTTVSDFENPMKLTTESFDTEEDENVEENEESDMEVVDDSESVGQVSEVIKPLNQLSSGDAFKSNKKKKHHRR